MQLAKLSHRANSATRAQFLNGLQQAYGNRYVQRLVSAYKLQNTSERQPKLVSQIVSRKGAGSPLEPEVARYMEPRFARDFSSVRVHTDSFAERAAEGLGARAFTIGGDVFFGAGWYSPRSAQGKELIAHELTHVVQQGQGKVTNNSAGNTGDRWEIEADFYAKKAVNTVTHAERGLTPGFVHPGKSNKIQCRLQYGAGNVAGDANFVEVPQNQRARVNAALDIIDTVARERRCQNYFRNNSAGNETLANLMARVRVWEYADERAGYLGVTDAVGGNNISYDPYVYRIGRWFIASTLIHEMMHAAGVADERTCEMAPDECYVFTPFVISAITPTRARIGDILTLNSAFSIGPSQGPLDKIEFNGIDAGRAVQWTYISTAAEHHALIRVRVPGGLAPGTVNVVVTNSNVRSNPRGFTLIP